MLDKPTTQGTAFLIAGKFRSLLILKINVEKFTVRLIIYPGMITLANDYQRRQSMILSIVIFVIFL